MKPLPPQPPRKGFILPAGFLVVPPARRSGCLLQGGRRLRAGTYPSISRKAPR